MNKKKLALAATIIVGVVSLLVLAHESYSLSESISGLIDFASRGDGYEYFVKLFITYVAISSLIIFFNIICMCISVFLFAYIYKNDFSLSKQEREEREKQKAEQKKQLKREKLQAKLDELNKE